MTWAAARGVTAAVSLDVTDDAAMSSSAGEPVLSLDQVATKAGGRTVWSQVSL